MISLYTSALLPFFLPGSTKPNPSRSSGDTTQYHPSDYLWNDPGDNEHILGYGIDGGNMKLHNLVHRILIEVEDA